MEPVKRVAGRMAPLDLADVDTDQIIPKQFLKRIERTGYGPFLFYDWRARGNFVLDRPEYAGASVLVAGANFGCGSSREHAPWALRDFGFRAVVSSSIADIFRSNALKNGLVPVVLDAEAHQKLLASPGAQVTIDLETRTLAADGLTATFLLDPFARHCLMNGIDELGFLVSPSPAIDAWEEAACA